MNIQPQTNLPKLLLIFTLVFFLLAVPASWLFFPSQTGSISEIENRQLAQFPEFKLQNMKTGIKLALQGKVRSSFRTIFSDFLKKEYQEDFEQATTDQFPFRLNLASLAREIEVVQIKSTYTFLPDPAFPASLDSDYYLLRNEPVYIQPPAIWNQQRRIDIDQRIENYQELMSLFPDTRFFVFYLERMAFAPYNPLAPYFKGADQGQSFEYFLENKPAELVVSSLRLKNLGEHKEYFYRTDHHWNIRGAWKAYEMIYEMLSAYIPDISPKLQLQGFFQIKGVEFCGSYARRTLYPCTPEKFEYASVELPAYKTFIEGEETEYGRASEYLKGIFSQEPFANHYAEFFGNVIPVVEYRFNNAGNRNLLIIGGSYTQAMQVYLASHYDQTYVVDLREYEDFSLGSFIRKHAIDDVIIIGDVIVYAREGWQIDP